MQPVSRFLGAKAPAREHILDFAVLMIILLVGWVYTFEIESVLDLGLYDESSYLQRGLLIPNGFPSAQSAPLYALWYYLLSLLQNDAIDLYFLNYKLMTVLPPLMLFITLRAWSVSRVLSLFLSFAFLFSHANFPTWPKVSHFAMLVLLLGFFLSSFVRNRILQTAALVITTFLMSYIRPELFLAFVCTAILLAFFTILDFKRTHSPRVATPLLAILLLCIGVTLWLDAPVGSGNRSMVAFGQHYARNWVRWEGDSRNPWTNWVAICANDFGNASSPSQAFFANPLAVVHHMFQNLSDFPRELASMFGRSYPGNRAARIALTFGITLLTAAAALARIRRGRLSVLRKRIRDNLRSGWLALTFLFIAALPVVISILLIAPRRHYLYMLSILSVIGVAILFFRKPGNANRESSNYTVVVLLCIIVLMITRPLSVLLPVHHQPNLKTITCLRDMNLATHVNLLEAEGGYGIYLGDNYTRVAEYAKDRPFLDFLAQRSINMIVVSPGLAGDLRFRNDPQWHSFSNSPESFGFTRVSIPGVGERERSLLVKREIIGSTAIPE